MSVENTPLRPAAPCAAGPSAPSYRPRGRAGALPEDIYIRAMLGDQARMFITEADNAIYARRLPSPYRRLLLPSPVGQARRGIAYTELEAEAQKPPPADIVGRTLRWLRAAWRKVRGNAQGQIHLRD